MAPSADCIVRIIPGLVGTHPFELVAGNLPTLVAIFLLMADLALWPRVISLEALFVSSLFIFQETRRYRRQHGTQYKQASSFFSLR